MSAPGRYFMLHDMGKRFSKLIHEKNYVAEVDVNLIYTDEGWSPYLSVEDAYKLDDVREALRRGDVKAASKLGSCKEFCVSDLFC